MYKISSYIYIDNDKNETILFLHGWGCNKLYMLPLAKKIKSCNCLIIDLPGFKDNELFKESKTFFDYIDYIYDFVKDYNVSYIIGHSFGGKLAISLANKIKIKHLFLLAGSLFNKKRYPSYYIKVWFYKIIKHIPLFKKYLHKFGSDDYKQLNSIMKKTMSNVINYNIKNDLKDLNSSVTMFYGTNDKVTPVYIGKKAKKYLKDSNLFIIDGNHFAYLNNISFIIKIVEGVIDYYG